MVPVNRRFDFGNTIGLNYTPVQEGCLPIVLRAKQHTYILDLRVKGASSCNPAKKSLAQAILFGTSVAHIYLLLR